jgi:hypothetical protein
MITHEEYMNFLKEYFGSDSPMAANPSPSMKASATYEEVGSSRKNEERSNSSPTQLFEGLMFESR